MDNLAIDHRHYATRFKNLSFWNLHDVGGKDRQIRELAALGENVPVVVFCIAEIDEGDEVAIGKNVYITRPDNFNQLRTLLARLLKEIPIAA